MHDRHKIRLTTPVSQNTHSPSYIGVNSETRNKFYCTLGVIKIEVGSEFMALISDHARFSHEEILIVIDPCLKIAETSWMHRSPVIGQSNASRRSVHRGRTVRRKWSRGALFARLSPTKRNPCEIVASKYLIALFRLRASRSEDDTAEKFSW